MASHLQVLIVEGYFGGNPELSFTPNGTMVANARLASTRQYTGKDGKKVDETIWFKVAFWGNLAKVIGDWTEKGSHVIVTGTLRVDEKGNPPVFQLKNGDWASAFEISAEKVRIIRGKQGTAPAEESTDSGDLPY